jgi:hypothetical protein
MERGRQDSNGINQADFVGQIDFTLQIAPLAINQQLGLIKLVTNWNQVFH